MMGKLAGDFVKGIADALGIRQCDACKRRQERLNDLHRRVMGKPKKGAPKR
jgi:hypothetical protein